MKIAICCEHQIRIVAQQYLILTALFSITLIDLWNKPKIGVYSLLQMLLFIFLISFIDCSKLNVSNIKDGVKYWV